MADIDAAFGDVGEFGAADAAAAGMGELSVDDGDAVPPLEPSPGAGEAFSIPGLTDDAPLPEAFAEDPMGPIAQWRLKREQEVAEKKLEADAAEAKMKVDAEKAKDAFYADRTKANAKRRKENAAEENGYQQDRDAAMAGEATGHPEIWSSVCNHVDLKVSKDEAGDTPGSAKLAKDKKQAELAMQLGLKDTSRMRSLLIQLKNA